MSTHLHLDPIGGISGDMFLAAMLATFPDARAQLLQDWADAGVAEHVTLNLESVREKGMASLRAEVRIATDAPATKHWANIRKFIQTSALRAPVQARAIAIFELLAQAEATCHGVPPERVHFHEIADWDSLADIIGAASVLEHADAHSFSVGPIPMGSGRVGTDHGIMPVPAPATTELLRGFELVDDGGKGERITPTGAAILAHLAPDQHGAAPRGRLVSNGMGAGRLQMEGIPNILRILQFDSATPRSNQQVTLVRFDVDDMTPEEISVAMDHLRRHSGVLDASYVVGHGKKGRTLFTLTVMCTPQASDQVIDACFAQTSTIGLRVERANRVVLPRRETEHAGLAVKQVSRPGGDTAKTENDAWAEAPTLRQRRALARAGETIVRARDD